MVSCEGKKGKGDAPVTTPTVRLRRVVLIMAAIVVFGLERRAWGVNENGKRDEREREKGYILGLNE